ncbi:MAG TPA: lipoprotein [Burkholderiaceae bacterium]|nr:lipoprotein [Burkholderiaceae bacterium]
MRAVIAGIVICAATLTGGCGVKGPLFLPGVPKEAPWPYRSAKPAPAPSPTPVPSGSSAAPAATSTSPPPAATSTGPPAAATSGTLLPPPAPAAEPKP